MSSLRGKLEGRVTGEAIVFWLCGAGALGGFVLKVFFELYVSGML